ncbi:TolC family protein [Hyphomonas jannaschiana]|uniref:Outer membrane efflux protein n=1 Tax=Hyphomonas jannaschiana VP2 TaxID=1280952 RepID=A0A059F9I5_9PROT|nr:TolC family protein [Hyphomonas jannaschiana]KCZ87260.1 Outer membrane efflux protein [Hyphomonas jannaschiana VP2]
MKRFLFAAALAGTLVLAQPAAAQTDPVVDLMEQAIRTSPTYRSAKADVDRASASARRIASGPYEFEINASGGQRKIDDPLASENRYTEWSAGISRTVRLPGKRQVDANLAQLETDLAGTGLDQSLFAEREKFAMLWSAWRRADLLSASSASQAAEALRIAELQQIAVDKGAERQIRADQLAAEAGLLQLQAEQDRTAAQVARAALVARYPDIVFPETTAPLDVSGTMIDPLFEATAEDTPAYRRAGLLAQQAKLKAQRARMEKRPDPTFGLDFGNEFGGSETSVMARVSIPIGGSARRAYAQEMSATATVAELDRVTAQREAFQAVQSARQSLGAAMTLYEKSLETAESSRKILETIQKGYDYGEITITEFLNGRRALISAERTVAEQRARLESDVLHLLALTGGPATE